MPDLMENPRTAADGDVPDDASGAPRVRQVIDTEDTIRRALARRASKRSLEEGREVTKSDAANEIFREALAAEIAELERIDRKKKRK